jgi:uncharacterized protein (TIGR00369 family)
MKVEADSNSAQIRLRPSRGSLQLFDAGNIAAACGRYGKSPMNDGARMAGVCNSVSRARTGANRNGLPVTRWTLNVDDLLTIGKQALASQPFSTLLGTELAGFSPGQAELRLPISPKLKQQHGFVHGGVLSYLADNALTFAGGSVLGTAVVTSEYKINYLRPAIGEVLIARASVIHSSKNQAVCRCEVWLVADGVEKLCAVAQGTIAKIGQASEVSPEP